MLRVCARREQAFGFLPGHELPDETRAEKSCNGDHEQDEGENWVQHGLSPGFHGANLHRMSWANREPVFFRMELKTKKRPPAQEVFASRRHCGRWSLLGDRLAKDYSVTGAHITRFQTGCKAPGLR